MQKVILVGGGGFAREILQYISSDIESGYLKNHELHGFIDDDKSSQLAMEQGLDACRLGWEQALNTLNAIFVIAAGSIKTRKLFYQKILEGGGNFHTYIHPSCLISKNAVIGKSVFIGPNSIINAGAEIGNNCAINVFCSVGHGAKVGEHSILSPYSALNGDSSIGHGCFLGTRATIFPGVMIGNLCTVDSHSYVKASVADKKIITTRSNYQVIDNRFIS
jgi:hypothetical protein